MDDEKEKACQEAGLKWTKEVDKLFRAFKKYLEAEGSGDPQAIDQATAAMREQQKVFDEARKAVKEQCDEPRTYEFPLGGGIYVEIDDDILFTLNHYRALMVLIKLGKKMTGGTKIVLKPKKAGRKAKGEKPGEPQKEVGGTYDGDADEITIYDWNDKGDFFSVDELRLLLKHELGHRVLNRLHKDKKAGKKSGKDIWDEFWNGQTGDALNKDPVSKGGKMPNDYAGLDAGEGFAVCFELYFDDGDLDPDTKKKIREVIRPLRRFL